jgi:CysZ protein
MIYGAIPPLIVGAIYVALAVALFGNIERIVAWLTRFAIDWNDPWEQVIHVVVGIALVGAIVLVAVYTFTAVTLAIGDPFYESISRKVEVQLGDPPAELDESFLAGLLRSIGSSIRFLALTAAVGIALFVLGFIPVVGQTVVPVLGALVGGWFLAIELSGFAFDARGLRLKDRRRMLGSSRATSVGFGVATYVLFLVPLGAVIVMPAAVAGATMLARDLASQKV